MTEGSNGEAAAGGDGGPSRVAIEHPCGSRVEICLRGAHVTSWRDAAGAERLFLSSRSACGGGQAIRGGVPVIFPQFADLGALPRHGFARTAPWTLVSARDGAGGAPARAVLRLHDSPATRAAWPHAFTAELTVVLDEALRMELSVTNPGGGTLEFTAALHTYFRVANVDEVAVEGLEGVRRVDKVRGGEEGVEGASPLEVRGEVDRVYLDVPGDVRFPTSPGEGITLSLHGFPDAVVWNPGPEKGAAIPDLGAGEYRRMLCVEAAVVGRPVALAPGEAWTGAQTLTPWPPAGPA